MGLWDLLKPTNDSIDINTAVERLKTEEGAVLLDVRDSHEYAMGHIPGSVNLSLSEISHVQFKAPNTMLPVFVCCHTGVRSARAVRYLKSMGYREVKNAGGIGRYHGQLVTGEDPGELEKPESDDPGKLNKLEGAEPGAMNQPESEEIPWVDGAEITVKTEEGQTVISANPEGLQSLAKQMMFLAKQTPGSHVHYDQDNALEEGSDELVIELVK